MEIVRSGRWQYGDDVDKPVDIVALTYDFWFELAEADEQLDPGEIPTQLGAEGVLFYVRFRHAGEASTPTWPDSGGLPTLDAAMTAAEERIAPTTIIWDQSRRGSRIVIPACGAERSVGRMAAASDIPTTRVMSDSGRSAPDSISASIRG